MPSRHSRIGPSSAERWVHCPPSLRLGEEYGAPDTGAIYAAEGTEAHELGEFLLRQAIGEAMEDPRPAMQFYNEEMQECAEGYRDTVLDLYNQLKLRSPDAHLYVEQEIPFEEYVPGGFGTSDCVIIGDGEMLVVDYKHGKGVPVSAEGEDGEGNPQLKCYALGAYLEGRRKEAGRAMLRNKAALKSYRQIERLLRLPATLPPTGTARQYAEQLWNNHVTTSEQPVADTPST